MGNIIKFPGATGRPLKTEISQQFAEPLTLPKDRIAHMQDVGRVRKRVGPTLWPPASVDGIVQAFPTTGKDRRIAEDGKVVIIKQGRIGVRIAPNSGIDVRNIAQVMSDLFEE